MVRPFKNRSGRNLIAQVITITQQMISRMDMFPKDMAFCGHIDSTLSIKQFRKQLIQEFKPLSKMTMLKSRISYAIQNSAYQIVGWKPKAADPTFQCYSLK